MRSRRARKRLPLPSWWPLSGAVVIVVLLVGGACSKATVEQSQFGTELYEAMKRDPLLNLDVPGGVAGEPFVAAGSSEPGVMLVPFQGGRTWTIASPSADLLSVVLSDLVMLGVSVADVSCTPGNGGAACGPLNGAD